MMPLYTRNLFILLTSTCLFFSSFYLLFPTLPLYVQSMGGGQKDVGIIIGVFTLSSVLFRPFAGTFTDKYGRKMLLILGALIFLVSPFFYYAASTVKILLLVRIFHGLGIAAFTTSSVTMIADLSPPTRRGEGFGAFGLAALLALSGSPAAGTWLQTHFSFRGVFSTEAVLAALSLSLCFFVRETFHRHELSKGRVKGAFLPSAIIFLCTITYGSIISFLPFFVHEVSDFGLFYTAYALSSIGIRLPVGRVSDRIGRQKIILPGLLTISVALLLLASSDSLISLLFSGFLYGLGFSTVYPTLAALLVDRVPEEARAQSLSIFTASFDLGIAGGSFIFGLFPVVWIYPLGALIVFLGTLFFYVAERSRSW